MDLKSRITQFFDRGPMSVEGSGRSGPRSAHGHFAKASGMVVKAGLAGILLSSLAACTTSGQGMGGPGGYQQQPSVSNQNAIGLGGAVLGGVLGNQAAKGMGYSGSGRTAGTILGAILGAGAGASVGQNMDQTNENTRRLNQQQQQGYGYQQPNYGYQQPVYGQQSMSPYSMQDQQVLRQNMMQAMHPAARGRPISAVVMGQYGQETVTFVQQNQFQSREGPCTEILETRQLPNGQYQQYRSTWCGFGNNMRQISFLTPNGEELDMSRAVAQLDSGLDVVMSFHGPEYDLVNNKAYEHDGKLLALQPEGRDMDLRGLFG
jgi:hypothetical protein